VRSERHTDDSPKSGIAGLARAPFRMRLHRVGPEPSALQAPASLIGARPNFRIQAPAGELAGGRS